MRAATPDQFKYDDSGTHTEGNVDGQVQLTFQHALCQINVLVQRVYNETSPSDPPLHPDNASDTKIFVGDLTLAASGLYQEGKLDLATGTWSNYTSPLSSVSYATSDLYLPIQGTTAGPTTGTDDEKAAALTRVRVYELNQWNTLYHTDGTVHADASENTQVAGVIETPRPLNLATRTAMLIPTSSTVTLTPTITYSFVTRDNSLKHDYLHY